MEEYFIKTMEDKLKQYEYDLTKVIQISSKIDKIKTAWVKVEFERLVVDEIKNLIELINSLKKYIEEQKE